MQTFNWSVRPNISIKIEPKVNVIKFGDGYEQRQKNGINNDLRSYSVELKAENDQAKYISAFLTEHGAVEPFIWRDPDRHIYIKVKCTSWNTTIDNFVTTITATFDEVIA